MNKQRGFVWWIYLIAAGVVMAALAAIVWKIHNTGYVKGKAEVQLAWDQAKAEQREKEAKAIEAATTKHEAQREKTRTVYRTITRNVDRIIDRPIYRDRACFDDDGLRLAREALRGPDSIARKPDTALPAADGARGRERRDSASKAD